MEETTKQEIAKNISKFTDLVIEPVKQRTAHPFISSYLISGLFVNWKAISCLIFSSKIIEEKIKYIETTFYPDESFKTFAIVTPLLIALFYTIVLKWFDVFIDAVNNVPVNYRILNQAKIKVNTLDAQVDIVKAQIRLNNARAENKELQELNDKISSLNEDIKIRDNNIESLTSQTQHLRNEITSMTANINELKLENSNIINKSLESIHFEKNLESLIKALFAELDKEQFNHILSKISDAGVPDHILKLADEAYKEKDSFPLHAYRIELENDFNDTHLKLLKGDLALMSNQIDAQIANFESNGIITRQLEVIYPSNIPAKEIRQIVRKMVPNIKRV